MENSRSSPLSIQDMSVYEEAGERNLNGLERMVFSACIGPGILPVLTSQTRTTHNSQDTRVLRKDLPHRRVLRKDLPQQWNC